MRLFETLGALAIIAACLFSAACSTDPGDADAGGKKATDAAATDVPLAFEVTVTVVDPFACPGGHACACAVDADCTYGLCIDGVDGSKSCSVPCDQACAAGLTCAELDKGGATIHHCVPAHVDLCNPCTTTDSCTSLGRGHSACLDYGGAGNFCGSSCDGDADCPESYACESASHADGTSSLQCVKKAKADAATGEYGVCGCSAKAKTAKLATACWQQKDGARCHGTRGCSATGLSACSASTPAAETCDGVDNDCNGITDEETCSDGNPCTADACKDGKCANTNTTDVCNADNSACTANDACKDGKCEAGDTITCDDNNPCTKDSCDAAKGCQSASQDAAPCDADGSKCTSSDACLDGVCTAGTPVVCDDKKPCTLDACDPTTGKISNQIIAGLTCDDGAYCSHTDLCQADGSCKGSARNCDDGNACTDDKCSGAKCDFTPTGGKVCDDGNKCSGADKCEGNVCKAGTVITCTASKPCTTSYCDGLTGKCVEIAAKAGSPCEDGNKCTDNDSCDAAGKCQKGGARVCVAVACKQSKCNVVSGKCDESAAGDGATCDDGEPCTEGSKCDKGACAAGTKKGCDDKKPCTTDSCVTGKGCEYKNLATGLTCDDGNPCNLAKCAAGSCLKTKDICSCVADKDCDDENPCSTGKCNSKQCAYSAKTAGDKCDDLDKCTANDKCTDNSGKLQCKGADKTECDDKEACTTDSCDSIKGCAHVALGDDDVCDDGSKCTTATKCKTGKCTGTEKTCPDNGKVCTPNTCEAATGNCKAANAKDGVTCSDGNKCTDTDVCAAGTCKGEPLAASVKKIAGSAGAGYKDGKGAGASFTGPTAVAVDSAGAAYVVEGTTANFYRIRKVLADGTTTTYAGQGLAGATDGAGNVATFRAPRGVAVIGTDVYVADTGNALIRKIDNTKKVTTLAGKAATTQHNGTPLTVYFGINTGSFKDGSGTAAEFNVPYGIAGVGTGTGAYLVVADMDNQRVRKVLLDGTVTTLAGTGVSGFKDGVGTVAQFTNPVGLAADGIVVYVASQNGHRIRKIAADGTVTTVAGNGSAAYVDGTGTGAQFKQPWSLTVDASKALLVADYGNNRVRKIVTATKLVSTYAGDGKTGVTDGTPAKASFPGLWGIAADGKGNTFVVGPTGHAVQLISDPFKVCVP